MSDNTPHQPVPEPAVAPEPQAGGAYVRDPVTGELQRVQFTRSADEADLAEETPQ